MQGRNALPGSPPGLGQQGQQDETLRLVRQLVEGQHGMSQQLNASSEGVRALQTQMESMVEKVGKWNRS